MAMPETIALRPFQQRCIHELRQAYAHGSRAPLLVSPTGSGKTVMFCYIAQAATAKRNKVLVLVHRRYLIEQVSSMLSRFGVDHDIVAPGHPHGSLDVKVASVQTLARRLDWWEWKPDLVIVDEAHHVTPTTQWGRVLEAVQAPTLRILGVTATPQRLDGQGLGDIFTSLVMGPTPAQLINLGYLSQPILYAPASGLDMSGAKTRGGDYAKEDVDAAIGRSVVIGSAVNHYRKYCIGERALVFCSSVKRAEETAQLFRESGVAAEMVDGKLSHHERSERLGRLESGHTSVITSCDLISEGLDIPAVSAAFLLRPTKSLALYLQQVGRALRPWDGKERTIIFDHVANSTAQGHGLPQEDRDWTLDAGRKTNGSGKRPSKIRQCPKCDYVDLIRDTCSQCGYVYPKKERKIGYEDGELVEVKREAFDRKKQALRNEVRGARTRADLERIALNRGYKRGWVGIQLKLKGLDR